MSAMTAPAGDTVWVVTIAPGTTWADTELTAASNNHQINNACAEVLIEASPIAAIDLD